MKNMLKMNVLQIADYKAPYPGNFIASLEALNNQLHENNCNMIYLFPEKAKGLRWVQELCDKNYFVYYYTNSIIKNFLLLRNIVIKHQINIFHVHFRNMKIGFPVTLAHILFRKTFYFTHMHGQYIHSFFLKEHLRRLARWDTFYIGCSETVSNQMKQCGISHKKVSCVENAIDFSRLDEYETLVNDEFEVDKDTKKILIFGYNWYIKGVDLALDAVANLIKEKRRIVLLISVAANKEVLESFILEKFGEIPRWVRLLNPRNDIASYYNFADVFISPSREEGFCYSLIEAAYCKVPLVASNIPAQRNLKLIGDIWVDSGSADSLKIGIEKALDFQDFKLLEDQKKIVVENYQLNRWTKGILNVYKEVSKFSLENE